MRIFKFIPNLKYMWGVIAERATWASEKYHISKIRLILGYMFCALFYGCTTIDYFYYKFFLLNRKGKRQFITFMQQSKYERKHSQKEKRLKLFNKEANLERFAEFVKRDWCGQEFNNSEEDYKSFAAKHSRGIIKPIGDYGGHGIRIVPTDEIDGMDLYTYCRENRVLVEELIDQHDGINAIYPKSINTLRVVTNNGELVGAAFRMGTGGGEVDNASSGGIYAEVDADTGIVISRGYRMNGDSYLIHPDSRMVIPGFRIPMWKECLKMVTDAVKLVDGVSLIGWDVAVSKSGPTIVEVNVGPGLDLIQTPNGHGVRDKFF